MKSTKKTLLLSGLLLVCCCSLLIGFTLAWFTESFSNKNNEIYAYDLDLDYLYRDLSSDGEYAAIQEDAALFGKDMKWQPGAAFGYDFKVSNSNEENLDAQCKMTFENVISTGGIADVLDVYVLDDAAAKFDGETGKIGTLAEVAGGVIREMTYETPLLAGESTEYSVIIAMRKDAGRQYVGKSVTFDVAFSAAQAFADAEFDEPAVSDVKDLITNAPEGSTVVLPQGTVISEPMPLNKTLTIDANGAVFEGGATHTFAVTAGEVTLKNATIKAQNKQRGISVEAGTKSLTLENCTFEGSASQMGHSVWINVSDENVPVVIKGCTFERPINAANVKNLTVEDCVFNLAGAYGGRGVNGLTLFGAVENITFVNNEINRTRHADYAYGVRFTGLTSAKKVVMEGNTFGEGGRLYYADKEAAELFYSCVKAGDIKSDRYEIDDAVSYDGMIGAQADGQHWYILKDIDVSEKNTTVEVPQGGTGWVLPIVANDIVIEGVDNPTVKSLVEDENAAWNQQTMVVVTGNNALIKGVTFDRVVNPNKIMEVVAKDFTLQDSTLIGGDGINLYFNGAKGSVLVAGNTFTGEGATGIVFDSVNSADKIVVEGNTFEKTSYYAVGNATWTSPATLVMADVQLNGNKFDNCADYLFRNRMAEGAFILDASNTVDGEALTAEDVALLTNAEPHDALTEEQKANRLVAVVDGREIRFGDKVMRGGSIAWSDRYIETNGMMIYSFFTLNKENTGINPADVTTVKSMKGVLRNSETMEIMQVISPKTVWMEDAFTYWPKNGEDLAAEGILEFWFQPTVEAIDSEYWNKTAMTATEETLPDEKLSATYIIENAEGTLFVANI